MSKIYGFARCSLGEEKGQDISRQVRELKAAGAEQIITERVHGDSSLSKPLFIADLARIVLQFSLVYHLSK